jgi:hypothetical protein
VPLLDLLVFKRGGRLGAEIKWMDELPLTGSKRIALATLQLAHLTIAFPASNLYELAPEVMDYPDHPASNQVGQGMPLRGTRWSALARFHIINPWSRANAMAWVRDQTPSLSKTLEA